MSNLPAKIKKEILELIPPAIFFLFTLHLVSIVRSLMLNTPGVVLTSWLTTTVTALLLAKTVLILDLVPLIKRFQRRPMIYNICWKTVLYLIATFLIHYGEELYGYWSEAGGFEAANRMLLDRMVWRQFWGFHIFIAVLLLMYTTMRELGRRLGASQMREIFLGPSPAPLE